jgi:DNA polymerase III epsilon subunit-like protein
MCEAWPGPRCSYDMSKKLKARKTKLTATIKNHGVDSPEASLAMARYNYTEKEYDATPEGINALESALIKNPKEADSINQRIHLAKTTRILQANALSEIRNGRVDDLATLVNGVTEFYNKDEVASVIESSREETEKIALRKKEDINFASNEPKYKKFLDDLEGSLKTKQGSPLPEKYQKTLDHLRSQPAPDDVNMTAYTSLPKALELSRKQLVSEIKNAAALQNVDPKVAAEYYEGYRKQYQEEFAHLSATERPDPPESWVRGEFSQSGYAKDPSSNFAPHDSASIYAIYRLRADENAIPDYMKNSRTIASIDLETANPQGKDAFEPAAGKIIEVGIISYNPQGKKVGSYSQLIKPEESFLKQNGTGAEHIHNISTNDLEGKPSWKSVEPTIVSHLKGKMLLAQNAPFEKSWLDHHLEGFNSKTIPIVDTKEISRKHFDLPNHSLKAICENNNIPYVSAHRATKDAEMTGEAYFKLRKKVKQTWVSKNARAKASILTEVPSDSRWNRK